MKKKVDLRVQIEGILKSRCSSRSVKKLVGLYVCYYRSARGMTQEELAKKAKISRASVANIEKGRHCPPLYYFYILAKALDVFPGQLLNVFPDEK